jgi:hypothetical protein
MATFGGNFFNNTQQNTQQPAQQAFSFAQPQAQQPQATTAPFGSSFHFTPAPASAPNAFSFPVGSTQPLPQQQQQQQQKPDPIKNDPGSKLVSSGEHARVVDLKELNVEKEGKKNAVGDELIEALRNTNTQISISHIAAAANKAKIETIRQTFSDLRSKMASCEQRVSKVVSSQGRIKKHGLTPLREELDWVSRQVHTAHERTRLFDAALQASYVEGGGGGGRGMRSALPSPILQEVEELSRNRARVLLAHLRETEDVSRSLGNSPIGIGAGTISQSHLQMQQRPEAKLAAEVNHMLSVLFPSLGGALATIAAENVHRMETECSQLRTTLETVLDKANVGGGGIGRPRLSPFDESDYAENEKKDNERRQIKKGLEDKLKSTLKETAKKAAEKKAEEAKAEAAKAVQPGVAAAPGVPLAGGFNQPTQPQQGGIYLIHLVMLHLLLQCLEHQHLLLEHSLLLHKLLHKLHLLQMLLVQILVDSLGLASQTQAQPQPQQTNKKKK